MLDSGILISGYFLGQEERRDKNDEPQQVVSVAVGLDSHRVYMKIGKRCEAEFGNPVLIKCRCYASRSGSVIFTDGEALEVEK